MVYNHAYVVFSFEYQSLYNQMLRSKSTEPDPTDYASDSETMCSPRSFRYNIQMSDPTSEADF